MAQCGSVGDGCLSIRLPGVVLALSLSGSEIWGGLTELPRPRCLRSGGSDGSKVCLWCGFSRIVRVKCSDRARPEAGAQGVTTGRAEFPPPPRRQRVGRAWGEPEQRPREEAAAVLRPGPGPGGGRWRGDWV